MMILGNGWGMCGTSGLMKCFLQRLKILTTLMKKNWQKNRWQKKRKKRRKRKGLTDNGSYIHNVWFLCWRKEFLISVWVVLVLIKRINANNKNPLIRQVQEFFRLAHTSVRCNKHWHLTSYDLNSFVPKNIKYPCFWNRLNFSVHFTHELFFKAGLICCCYCCCIFFKEKDAFVVVGLCANFLILIKTFFYLKRCLIQIYTK